VQQKSEAWYSLWRCLLGGELFILNCDDDEDFSRRTSFSGFEQLFRFSVFYAFLAF